MDAREKQAEKENELNSTLSDVIDEEAEEDNADINFEVRAEKLKAASSNQVIVNDLVEQEVQQESRDTLSKQGEMETDHDSSMSIYDAHRQSNKQPNSPDGNESRIEEVTEGSHLS